MAGAGVTTGPFGIVHGFDAGTRVDGAQHDPVRRTVAETRQYLDDADELLRTENTATGLGTPRNGMILPAGMA